MKKHLVLYAFLVATVFCFSSAAAASTNYYTVQKGDSMYKIAKKMKVKFAEILRLNSHYDNVHLIHPDDKILLPDSSSGTGTEVDSADDGIASGSKTVPDHAVTDQAEAVLILVNAERTKQGLKELTLSDDLTSLAQLKAEDMAQNGYFDHTSPTYGTPLEMLQAHSVSYKSAGENIAAGQQSAKDVMDSWMQSSGHRANILNSSFTQLGVGYYVGGSYKVYWTQLFTG